MTTNSRFSISEHNRTARGCGLRATFFATAAALTLCVCIASGQTRNDLLTGFRNIPPEAKPRVWWHWMNANVTQAGIGKDLDWLKRVGVGGFMNFDGAASAPVLWNVR